MKKRKLFTLGAFATLALGIASCQAVPINASTTITNTNGAGSKTISAFMLVDGSCQIEPSTGIKEGNEAYYLIEDADFSEVSFTPKVDGAKVKYIADGYFTNPNNLSTPQEIWDEFNGVVESYIPEGFEFSITEVQSSGWNDDYMSNIPGPEVTEWKAYVYHVTYSWESVDEYIEKTKVLMGESYGFSHLAELEEAGTPWATFKKDGDEYVWSEAYLVNYWSVYDICDQIMNSDYFNNAPFGPDYAVTTDNAFCCALQTYKIGDGEEVTVLIDNLNGLDSSANPIFIEARGKLVEPTNWALIIGVIVVAVVVIAGVTTYIVVKKKKAAKK